MTPTHAWLIAYIDRSQIKNLEIDLQRYDEYQKVTAYVPLIRILRKKFKGEEQFEEVPLLFNYGFFKMPRYLAASGNFLENLKAGVGAIFAWVNDPAKVYARSSKGENTNFSYLNCHIPVGTATDTEIDALVKAHRENTIFSMESAQNLKIGDVVTLKKYPWEGMDATIREINHKRKKVKVSLFLFAHEQEIEVSFDSVFFTIYQGQGYDDSLTQLPSLDDLKAKNVVDKVFYKNQPHDTDKS